MSSPSHTADPDPGRRPPTPRDGAVVVLGDGAAASAISRRLERQGRPVSRLPDLPAGTGDAGLLDRLRRDPSPLADAATVVVATRSDSRNLLTAQHLRTRFGIDRVHVLANDPDRVPAFVHAGHEPICAASAAGDAIATTL